LHGFVLCFPNRVGERDELIDNELFQWWAEDTIAAGVNRTHEVLTMAAEQVPVVMEEVADPAELAKARAQDARFKRNLAWFEAHAPEVYNMHRGKCICVAGEELFSADLPEEVLALATAAHPEDDGRFSLIVPRKRSRP
jgi:hypothetical protein